VAPEPELLSLEDAQILRLESAAIKGHTGKVLILDPRQGAPLAADHLRERVRERIGQLDRLRQKVVEPKRGRLIWVDDPELDLNWHVASVEAPEPLGDRELRELVGSLLAERLDHRRPLWRIDVAPLTGGRTALIGRIHHAMADGVSALRLAAQLLWDGPESSPAPRGEAAKGAAGRATPNPQPSPPSGGRRLLARLPGALQRELRPGAESPLDRHIGPDREVAWTTVPLSRLKGIEHAAGEGVTVNDVVLAVVGGALRRWFDHEETPQNLRVQVPVCLHLRAEDADEVSNRDSFLNVDLPVGEDDPAERLRSINAETLERKVDHDAEEMYAFFHALGRFRPLYRGVTRLTSGPREFALSVSNVPGPRQRQLILEHPVVALCSFAEPADRHALRVAVVSHGGELAFGLCSDPGEIIGLDRLATAVDESVAELSRAFDPGDREG
jgi:WS/DGAT/MGAT family acyltransferase